MIDIAAILTITEKQTLEAKRAKGGLPNSVWETYSSFANTSGGTIVLGLDEDMDHHLIPTGVPNADKLISEIWNGVNNPQIVNMNILTDRCVYSVEYGGQKFVVIEVPEADRRDKPIYVGTDMIKGAFRRDGEGDYHCRLEHIKAMLRDQSDVTPDSHLLDTMGIDVLNMESVKRYRILFNNLKENHVWSNLDDNEFLVKIGAAQRSNKDGKIHPTLGGLIFFGEYINIINELPYYFLDYREHMVEDIRWSDRVCSGDGNWSGNVFDFYFKIIERLTSDVKIPFAIGSDLLRVNETSVHKGLREALANALIHADYYGRQGIVIDKEFRKITIGNPGKFRIDVSVAKSGGISDARNIRIFNMFALINVGERSGMGLCDLIHIWKEAGFKEPEIVQIDEKENQRTVLSLEINTVMRDNLRDNRDNQEIILTEYEREILNLIRIKNDISISKIANELGLSRKKVELQINSMKQKGVIRREGSTRGKWIIV